MSNTALTFLPIVQVILILILLGFQMARRSRYKLIDAENKTLRQEVVFRTKVLQDHNDMLSVALKARSAERQEILIHLFGDMKYHKQDAIIFEIVKIKKQLKDSNTLIELSSKLNIPIETESQLQPEGQAY